MPITIQDVAAMAGVSASTVSRVLNKNRDISSKTVAVVESAIQHLGYRRADTRRGRRPARPAGSHSATTRIALLIPDAHIEAMQTPLAGKLIHGIERVARIQGLHLLLTRLAEDGGLPPCLTPVQVEGLIVRSGSAELAVCLPPVPTVWVFKPTFEPYRGDLVYPDNAAIGHIAATHLLERGHRQLAVINGIAGHPEAQLRCASFVHAIQSAGLGVQTLEVERGEISAAVSWLLSQTPLATGLFLPIGDACVEGIYRGLQSRGRRGDAVDMIACSNDGDRLAALDPRLPNIDIQSDEIGRIATELLLWRMQNPWEHRRCILVQPLLVNGLT